jgi:hypothetical protein
LAVSFALSIYHRIAPLLIDFITRIRHKRKASAPARD